MYDIIPDLQLPEITDFRALITLNFPLFLFGRTKNISLRNDREFQHWVFKTLFHMSVKKFCLAGQNLPVRVFAVKGAQLLLPQIGCQTLRPGPGCT